MYFVKRDLFERKGMSLESVWELPNALAILAKQQANGCWRYPARSVDPLNGTNYNLLETFRNLRFLVDMYGFHREHTIIQKAAEFLFSCQTEEGDIRGILGNQYMPYYHGAILTLLIKAGYHEDERIHKGLNWLLSIRQTDGGWIIPAQAVSPKQKTSQFWTGPAKPPDRSLPSAHIATDMVLRAFAAHPAYRIHLDVLAAARLLKGRLFQADKYNDRKGSAFWLKFQYPFWWHSLVATLDSLSWLGFNHSDEDIARGLAWFSENQSPDGLWETGYGSGQGAEGMRRWVGLAVCRLLKKFFDNE
jgi:hypothetical protein